MSLFKSIGRAIKKVAPYAAIGAAAWYTGGAALTVYARAQELRAAGRAPTQGGPPVYYSAPFNPGYSYSGAMDGYGGGYGGSAFQAYGGTGGAAIPIEQSSGEARSPGFQITPVMAIAGVGVLLLGFLAFRR